MVRLVLVTVVVSIIEFDNTAGAEPEQLEQQPRTYWRSGAAAHETGQTVSTEPRRHHRAPPTPRPEFECRDRPLRR